MEPTPAKNVVMGHEVIRILAERGGACPVEELRAAAGEAFGRDAVYGNCHGDRFHFDGLLRFLSLVGKLTVDGPNVAVGWVPACSGHDHDGGHEAGDEAHEAHEHS